MRIKMILPALTEALSPYWRSIKYSLFPPLGLATLAGYCEPTDEIVIQDEHVEDLDLDDRPDLVAIQVYVTSAYRAYEIADHYRKKGVYVALGGLHVTARPQEAQAHADSIFCGPGEDIWPRFLEDFRRGQPQKIYHSTVRSLIGMPKPRRDLIKRELYLVPNSIVVSRGCPHNCDFCYKSGFFKGGKSFYTQSVDRALAEISELPGKHLFFLDDNLFADEKFASALFEGMRGMGRVWQAAGTVQAVLKPGLLEKAVRSGLKSLFVGFETLNQANLKDMRKFQNMDSDYNQAAYRLHTNGVMINASFVFGMDEDDPSVFGATTDWAVEQGIETATFHILTPYPGTPLYERMAEQGRLFDHNWNHYDTRHAVFTPAKMSAQELEDGYWGAYRDFYKWSAIFKAAWTKESLPEKLRHLAYSGGWKKAEPLWDWIIQHGHVRWMIPLLEKVLSGGQTARPGLSHDTKRIKSPADLLSGVLRAREGAAQDA